MAQHYPYKWLWAYRNSWEFVRVYSDSAAHFSCCSNFECFNSICMAVIRDIIRLGLLFKFCKVIKVARGFVKQDSDLAIKARKSHTLVA